MNDAVFLRLGLTVILCLSGLVFQRTKIISILQMGWIMIITCFNTMSVDWLSNFEIYQNSSLYHGFFGWLMNFFKNQFHVDFYIFNGVLAAISLILIFYVIVKETQRPNIVLSFWMIFPMIDNIVQKRYFWGFGLVVVAVYLLIKVTNKWLAIVAFELLILLAYSIHNAYIFFLFLPFFLLLSRKKQIIIVFIGVILGLIFSGSLLSISQELFPDLSSKVNLYFGALSNIPIASLLLWGAWQFVQLYIVYELYRNDKNVFGNLIIGSNIFFVILIPLYIFDPVFIRCFRPILLFNYIGMANKITVYAGTGNQILMNRRVFCILIVDFIITLVTFYLFDVSSITSVGFDSMVKMIYSNNSFLNLK